MDTSRFAELLRPAFQYYNKTPDPEVVQLYWEELGGYSERQIESSVRKHIAISKFWPKIVDLRKHITGRDEEHPPIKRESITGNQRVGRHYEIASRLVEDPAYQYEDRTVFNLEPLVNAARRVLKWEKDQGTDDRLARSRVEGWVWMQVVKQCEGKI